jgi:adenylate cyclase
MPERCGCGWRVTQGYLTLKGPAVGMVRSEFEYPIPLEDAETILSTLCQPPLIEKQRYRIPGGGGGVGSG